MIAGVIIIFKKLLEFICLFIVLFLFSLTNFYMGQNVKAYHHGQWYDARVITVGKISHGDVLSSMMDFEARFVPHCIFRNNYSRRL